MPSGVPPGVVVLGSPAGDPPSLDRVLTTDALAFVAELHRTFDGRRRELLAARAERQRRLDAGGR